ncbi:hypothetical protein DES53_10415 [Roseimicrobium gellanilyticum]|uniref:Uncharacterized protein n=1 Tax=Roseimicrobium gellanilyticum TaxID=748857 RepID=A0A366HN34_9BACT|nr:hypothetical protein [Roseimicrobium gellanilyticum]RBP44196.1 hypothetical protein DES53_10415 [Roseimicrobium gellanilyticum]
MSFRRNSDAAHAWKSWMVRHRDTLLECGVPHDVLEHERHWTYFLDHGYFTPAGLSEPVVSIDLMEKSQLKRLHALLSQCETYEACCILPDIGHLLTKKG